MGVEALSKPRGTWCSHCDIGHGCRIYDTRPDECRDFYCAYLTSPALGPNWFPARSKMVVSMEFEGERLAIHVDPSRPHSWREQPYYADIKRWATVAARDLGQVVVSVQGRSIVILPNADVDLGVVGPDEGIVIGEVIQNGRMTLRAMKVRKDDPRLAGTKSGQIYGPDRNPFG